MNEVVSNIIQNKTMIYKRKIRKALPMNSPARKGRAKDDSSVTLINGISGRLKNVRTALSKTQAEIGTALGLGKNTWQNYENAGQIPGGNVLAGLVRLGFNSNWILTGIGPMRLDELVEPGTVAGERLYARIPAVAEEPAQYGAGAPSIGSVSLNRQWLDSIGVNAHDLLGIIAQDDSMQPTMQPGALVYADSAREAVNRAGVWAFSGGQGPMIARAQPGKGNDLHLQFDNSLYKSRVVPIESMTVLGRVIWAAGPVP